MKLFLFATLVAAAGASLCANPQTCTESEMSAAINDALRSRRAWLARRGSLEGSWAQLLERSIFSSALSERWALLSFSSIESVRWSSSWGCGSGAGG